MVTNADPASLIEQLRLYECLARTLNTPILDTTDRTVDESIRLVLRLIKMASPRPVQLLSDHIGHASSPQRSGPIPRT